MEDGVRRAAKNRGGGALAVCPPHPEEPRVSTASRRMKAASWFETRAARAPHHEEKGKAEMTGCPLARA